VLSIQRPWVQFLAQGLKGKKKKERKNKGRKKEKKKSDKKIFEEI
jgi:hypothetical protein